MSTVVLGQNRFVDCDVILGYKGEPLLRVALDPLRVELTTPPGVRSVQIHVDPNGGNQPADAPLRVVRSQDSFAIFWNEQALVVATLLDTQTAHVKLDLRPLGINIYDDFRGLHIGSNTFTGNEIRRTATAIALSD
jgi:hypothetical protein